MAGDGAPMVDCPACGEPNPGRARFCLACGEPLPSPAARPGGSRRAVTVVFSDLSGSTTLGERLDPESLSQVMARYYETMRAVVRHQGGTVEKFAGDAIMAVFGIPAAHEDDALRAVRAASDMHAALGRLNQELWPRWRVRLELHTGVNMGEVVAGDPGLGGALVVGDAVNLAARLEQAAGAGQILLGRAGPGLGRRPPQRRQHAAGAAGAGGVGGPAGRAGRGRDAAGPGPGADHPGRRRQPLFIEELLATLVEEGRLRRQGGAWTVAGDLAGSRTPPTIQALVAARLDRLDGRDRDVLERAAVVGQAFEQDTVAALSPPDARAEVPERLGRLVRREFLRTAPARLPAEAGYQFRHLLVRDAVYQSVPKQVRADLHERLAGLLEARAGARGREYEEIVGHHLEQAWRCLAELGPLDGRSRASGPGPGRHPAATVLLDRAVALLPDGYTQLALLRTDLAGSLITAGDCRRGDQTVTEALAGPGPDDAGLRAHVLITRLNETRMQFTNQVTGVLMEAYGEAGQDLVDPELVAALTEA